MGMLRPGAAGDSVLRAAGALGSLGSGDRGAPSGGPRLADPPRRLVPREEAPARRIFRSHHHPHPQLLRLSLPHLRASQLSQRDRTDLPAGRFPGGSVQPIRSGGHGLRLGVSAVRAGGSHGAALSEGHQVHDPQIRTLGIHRDDRRPLRSAAERRQREDLRLRVVLADYSRRAQRPGRRLQNRRLHSAVGSDLSASRRDPSPSPHQGEHIGAGSPVRRLVSPLPARAQRESHRLSRTRERNCRSS